MTPMWQIGGLRSVAAACAFLLAGGVQADVPGQRFTTEGKVVSLDHDSATLTLQHEAVESALMPPMRMRMPVVDPSLLDRLKVGNRVLVIIDRSGGKPTVFAITKID